MKNKSTKNKTGGFNINVYSSGNNIAQTINQTFNGNVYYGQDTDEKQEVTDEQLADAISSICGKGKPLDEYQKWLGVCCYVSAHCDYPIDIDACCQRLAVLPYKEPLEYMPQYKSIRVYATYNFVKVGYDSWKTFKANDQERNLFVKCYDTALALDKALNKRSTE
jgi:hypothetical protein